MTAIAGAVCLDGRPADAGLATQMLAALAHRRGTPSIACAGPAALGARARSAGSPTSDGHTIVAFHGVLYDRCELARELELDAHTRGDAALAAAAYARWGTDCLARLTGDFSFAAWDGRESRLVCARDPIGTKPFYYTIVGRLFLFATEVHALFACPALSRRPNLGMAAEMLSGELRSCDETLFDGVFRLPAAHLLVLAGGRTTTRRYWMPSARASHDSTSDEDWAAALREHLDAAVRRRVADQRTVAVSLSGGLDSTAITALAAAQCGTRRVRSYSLIYDEAGCDEREYVSIAAAAIRHDARRISPPRWDPQWIEEEASRYLNWPEGANDMSAAGGLYDAASADGFTALLTGEGGDEWFTGSPFRYADFISNRQFSTLMLELRRAPAFATAWRRLVFAGIWPTLPSWLRHAARLALGRRAGGPRLAPWLDRDFVRASGIEDRRRLPEYDPRSGMSRASWDIALYLSDAVQAQALELADRAAARFGLEERHPFYDRDLIAFALTLPEAQRYQGGESKRVLRRALSGLVPEPILRRRDKGDYTPLAVRVLDVHGGERLFDRLAIAEAGWVRPRELRAAYRRAMSACKAGRVAPDLGALRSVHAVDCWFRHAILGVGRGAA